MITAVKRLCRYESSLDRSDNIARLNDQFRRTFIGGKVLITCGVAALSENDVAAVLDKVHSFNDLTEDNDPYGEHDFGSFIHDGEKIFWLSGNLSGARTPTLS